MIKQSTVAALVLCASIFNCSAFIPIISNIFSHPPKTITVWIPGTQLWQNGALLHHGFVQPGLNLATNLPHGYQNKRIAQRLARQDHHQFPLDSLYLFGWSGHADIAMRENAAHDLYQALIELTTSHHNCKFNITIITHSHGGNVALNLAKVKKDFTQELSIDRLVLLACPVQGATQHCIDDPLFKKVYSLYSTTDLLQIADPQGLEYANNSTQLLSGRVFSSRRDNLTQVNMSVNRGSLQHEDFRDMRILNFLPALLTTIDAQRAQMQKQEHLFAKTTLMFGSQPFDIKITFNTTC